MKDLVYIIFTKHGVDRMVKTESFTLKAGEKAFKLAVEVPDAAFTKPPIPTVSMTLAPESLYNAIEIDAKDTTMGESSR